MTKELFNYANKNDLTDSESAAINALGRNFPALGDNLADAFSNSIENNGSGDHLSSPHGHSVVQYSLYQEHGEGGYSRLPKVNFSYYEMNTLVLDVDFVPAHIVNGTDDGMLPIINTAPRNSNGTISCADDIADKNIKSLLEYLNAYEARINNAPKPTHFDFE